jgi:DUF1365 family protein
MTAHVVAHIYGQAVRLKLKGAPYHANPSDAPLFGPAKRRPTVGAAR